ncbi:hypothetical protein BDR03DRAFT_842738, partial [Suillus americanus]
FECSAPNCTRCFKNNSGLMQHTNTYHTINNVTPAPGPCPQDVPLPPQPSPPPREFVSPPPDFDPPPQSSPLRHPSHRPTVNDKGDEEAEFMDPSERYYRTYHSVLNGRPCTADGVFLPPGAPPTLPPPKSAHDWSPYRNDIEFATAEFTFKQRHMSNAAADTLFDLMAALLAKHNDNPPFTDHKDLHKVIDTMQLGNVPW